MIQPLNLFFLATVILSFFGYGVFLHVFFKIAFPFCYSITAASIITVLFFTGLIGSIHVVTYIIWGIGILLLLYEVVKKQICRSHILNPTNVVLTVIAVGTIIFLAGRRFIFIDDFNHWAVIARSITEKQTLPTQADLSRFVTYPPGAALWISYIVTLIGGTTEDTYLIAQALLIAVYMSPLTWGVDQMMHREDTKNTLPGRIILLVSAGGICIGTMLLGEKIVSLCVDGLLAASGIAGICFILGFRGAYIKRIVFSIPLMISTLLIKDFGMLLVVFQLVALFYMGYQTDGKKNNVLQFAAVFSVGLAEVLWQWHCYAVFSNPSVSAHSVSLERYISIFRGLSGEQIKLIVTKFIKGVLSLKCGGVLIGIITFLFIIWRIGVVFGNRMAKKAKHVLIFVSIQSLIYFAGLLFVYLFSMEAKGAVKLESFTRYNGTEFLFLIGLCFFYLNMVILSGKEQECTTNCVNGKFLRPAWFNRVGFACMGGVLAVVSVVLIGNFSTLRTYAGSIRENVHVLTNESYIGDVVIYSPSLMDGYYNELFIKSQAMYDFRSSHISIVTLDDVKIFEETLSKHSHILFYDVDDTLRKYLADNGCEDTDLLTPGLFELHEGNVKK